MTDDAKAVILTLTGMDTPIPSFRNTLSCEGFAKSDAVIHEQMAMHDRCQEWVAQHLIGFDFHFTKSCTQSLEMAIMALALPAGSEVILPSYGFVSLANAVALCGHRCVFVDCEPNTLNISFPDVVNAVTEMTGAVIVINYGGIPCDFDSLVPFCEERGIRLIEDNAHGLLSAYRGRSLGTFGHISTFSFDSLKMITCYEGGVIATRVPELWERIRKVHQVGTDRHDFMEGKVPFYEWKSLGTNATLAPPLFHYLSIQFDKADAIKTSFVRAWERYGRKLGPELALLGLSHSTLPSGLDHNGYIFWIMTRSAEERQELQRFMSERGVTLNPHYSALHRSGFGQRYHEPARELPNTDKAVQCMLRLPLFLGITEQQQSHVVEGILAFYKNRL